MNAELTQLRDLLEALLDAHESHVRETGIKCDTRDCVFFDFFNCHLRRVILRHGACPHYNPKLTFADVSPGYKADAAPEDRNA
jgi:hypothetical protein